MATDFVRIITGINFNWMPDTSYVNGSFDSWNVKENPKLPKDVLHIEEHLPKQGGADFWYEVYFFDGTMVKIFNVNQVFYAAKRNLATFSVLKAEE